MAKLMLKLLCCLMFVHYSTQFWFSKPKKEYKWDQLSVKLPGLFGGSKKLPMTEKEAKTLGWKKTDESKCDGNEMYRGNRYRYANEYGTMLLFDSNGRITGMQVAVPTSVPMAEKRKYMMPIAGGRYHLTLYFNDPSKICNAPKRGDNDIGNKFLIQTGATWEQTMNVPIDEDQLGSTSWVKGKCVPFMGTFFWYQISKKMDCENTFPMFILYSNGKLKAFGWTFKGYFNDPKFDHPSPSLASMAFDSKTFPECIATAKKRGSTQQIYLKGGAASYGCSVFG